MFASLIANDLRQLLGAAVGARVVKFEPDCGWECINKTNPSNMYHSSTRSNCPATLPGLEQQVTNPVGILPAGNDVLIQLSFSLRVGTTTLSDPISGIITRTENGFGEFLETDANACVI